MNSLKAYLILLVMGLMSGTLWAQDISLPDPKPPFLRELPATCSWRIAFLYDGKEAIDPTGEKAGNDSGLRRVREIQGSKQGGNRREISIWSNGMLSETWLYKGYILSSSVGSSDVSVREANVDYVTPGAYTSGFGQTDFPELGWLSLKTYKGLANLEGRPCYVFERASENGADSVKAFIDGKSLRPLMVQLGKVQRRYTYDESPVSALTPPPNFIKEMERYQRAMAVTDRHRMP